MNGGNGRATGRQLRIPGLSLKVRGRGKRGPALSTFKLPAVSTPKFDVDLDTELRLVLYGPDGEVLVGYYLRCDDVRFKKHRPAKGQPWIERIQALTAIDADNGEEIAAA